MSYDELELDRLGDEKSALFFLISDTDTTYNFIIALAFSQMFNLLCERADNKYGGRLPYHVRVLWDEAANTGQVPSLEKIVAVIRSREISLTLFYQAMSQCKALYKDNSETIMGNMDSIIFLGGREASTLKDISENWLGKATISMQTEGRSRGQSESYSQNIQRLGRELMTTSEIKLAQRKVQTVQPRDNNSGHRLQAIGGKQERNHQINDTAHRVADEEQPHAQQRHNDRGRCQEEGGQGEQEQQDSHKDCQKQDKRCGNQFEYQSHRFNPFLSSFYLYFTM